jgi:hypothetical protein
VVVVAVVVEVVVVVVAYSYSVEEVAVVAQDNLRHHDHDAHLYRRDLRLLMTIYIH